VVGWAVRLHPVAVAVCVIGGTSVAGLMGAIVSVPLVSIVWAVYQALRRPRGPRPPLPPGLVEPKGSNA
jgi:predicted PurR-regulated permease PerM